MATWTIANLERNLADGGVTVAHWRVTESETVGDWRRCPTLLLATAL